MTEVLDINDFADSILKEFQNFALKYTLQIIRLEKQSDFPKPLGSAVLVKYKKEKFLISASHLFNSKQAEKLSYLTIDGKFHSFGGEMIYTKNQECENSNKIDLAIIRLDDYSVQELEANNYDYYSLDYINIDYDNDKIAYLFGFPISRTKVQKHKNNLLVKPWAMLNKIIEIKFENYNPKNHLFLTYQKKKLKKKGLKGYVRGPKPVGMSGSGIWRCTNIMKETGKLNFLLSGIFIENIKERSLIIGTKINQVLTIIDRFSSI